MPNHDTTTSGAPTRRDLVKYGGALAGGGAIAGCSELAGQDENQSQNGTPGDGSYSVEMAPMGEITFDSVPENVFSILPHHVDMAVAVGRSDSLNAMHGPDYYESLWSKFLHRLEGVSVDWSGLYSSWPPTKEKLIELDSDVHLADPAKVATAEGLDANDVEEIAEIVAPWFGNTLSGTQKAPPEAYADSYEYYPLWEIFRKIAQVFQAETRYQELAAVRESMLNEIERRLPSEGDRPTAAMVLFSTADDGKIWGYKMNHPGYYAAHSRPLGATDALADAVGPSYGDDGRNIVLDYELLLEADPDVLLVFGPMTESHDIEEIRTTLANHDVASELTAVQNDRIHVQGSRRQGPLLNLFQTEMTAKQLYPDAFGEWPTYTEGPYPEIPADEQLFDRGEVADIVNGEI